MRLFRCLGLLCLFMLGACTRSSEGGPSGEAKLVVRVYEVPADSTDKMRSAVAELLGVGNKQPLGAVSSPGPGQLFVLAPSELQDGIAGALKEIRGTSAATPATTPAAAKQLRLDYWNIDALPGTGSDDPALAVVQPALAKIRKSLGAVQFQLNNRAGGVSSPGEKVSTHYATATGPSGSLSHGALDYTLRSRSDGLQLDISLSDQTPDKAGANVQYHATGFSSAIMLQLGETIVISDSPVTTGNMDAAGRVNAVRLNVVRVEEVPSA